MTRLQAVPSVQITEHEFIRRAIPKLASKGSGHLGTNLSDLTEIFELQFDKSPTETLNKMIRVGAITVALIEWESYYDGFRSQSKPKSTEILKAMPVEIPEGKSLRIYLSDNVPRHIRARQKRRDRLHGMLEEIKK